MRPLFLIALSATLATAESAPSWWPYASPEATTLVRIRWDHLRHTPFASVIESAISPAGPLGFPDLDCLKEADEIVISSPTLLVELTGNFPVAIVAAEASRHGLRGAAYRGVTLWVPEFADKLGLFQVSEHIVLVGSQPTLRAAIDAEFSETGHRDSGLLSRAAHVSQNGDLLVMASKVPDPLVSLFVPLNADGSDFLCQGSVSDGIAIKASLDAGTEKAAAEFARSLRERTSSFPALARGLDVVADRSRVAVTLQAGLDDLMTAIHPPQTVAQPQTIAPAPAGAEPQPAFTFEVTHLESSRPRIIRIFNLDEGTREITLPLEQPAVQVIGAER